jgi:hypothetical protein
MKERDAWEGRKDVLLEIMGSAKVKWLGQLKEHFPGNERIRVEVREFRCGERISLDVYVRMGGARVVGIEARKDGRYGLKTSGDFNNVEYVRLLLRVVPDTLDTIARIQSGSAD